MDPRISKVIKETRAFNPDYAKVTPFGSISSDEVQSPSAETKDGVLIVIPNPDEAAVAQAREKKQRRKLIDALACGQILADDAMGEAAKVAEQAGIFLVFGVLGSPITLADLVESDQRIPLPVLVNMSLSAWTALDHVRARLDTMLGQMKVTRTQVHHVVGLTGLLYGAFLGSEGGYFGIGQRGSAVMTMLFLLGVALDNRGAYKRYLARRHALYLRSRVVEHMCRVTGALREISPAEE